MNGYTYFPHEYLSQDFYLIPQEEIPIQNELTIHLCIFSIKTNISQIKYSNMSIYKERIPYLSFHLEKQNDEYSFPTIQKYLFTTYEQFTSDCYLHLIKIYGLEQSSPEPISSSTPKGREDTTESASSSPLLGFFIHDHQIVFMVDYDQLIVPFNKPKELPPTQKPAIVDEFMRVRKIHSTPISKYACDAITLNIFARTIYHNGVAAPYPIRFYHAILSTDESSPSNEGTLENVLESDVWQYNRETSLITNEQTSEHPIFGQLYLFTDEPVVQGTDELYLRYACYLSKARYFDDVQKELNAELPAKTSQRIREERLIPKIVEYIKRVNLELGTVKEYKPPDHEKTAEEYEMELIEMLSDISTIHFLIDGMNVCGLKYNVQFAHY